MDDFTRLNQDKLDGLFLLMASLNMTNYMLNNEEIEKGKARDKQLQRIEDKLDKIISYLEK